MLSLESHIRLFNEKSCKVVSEYMKVIDIIFCKLNIRNCIMHGLGVNIWLFKYWYCSHYVPVVVGCCCM